MTHRSQAPKTKTDNHLSIKDSESLDTCIQNTLSALYPPFEATAATVLWQLFHVVEKSYRGDGLRCLIDFLVPAKRILQCIQQDTCARYTGLIFRHEGWPLCVHEKVVVQLASLHRVPLKPGDFYIQIVPQGNQSAKLVIKCLSRNGQSLEEVLVPECIYPNVFTMEFLENVNRERNCSLHSCLLTSGTAVLRVHWKNVINPAFVNKPKPVLTHSYYSPVHHDQLIDTSTTTEKMPQMTENSNSPDHCMSGDAKSSSEKSAILEDKVNCGTHLSGSTQSFENGVKQKPSKESSKGDCLFPHNPNNTEVSPLPNLVRPLSAETPTVNDEILVVPVTESRINTKVLTFATDLSSPCQRRKQHRDSIYLETRRLFRKSYMEALQNPMQLGFSSEESIAEEIMEHKTGVISNGKLRPCANRAGEKQNRKHDLQSDGSKAKGGNEDARSSQHCQDPNGPVTLQERSSVTDSRTCRRRSKSLDMAYKNLQGKALRTRFSSGDSSRNQKKILNGHSVEPGKLEHDVCFANTGSSSTTSAGSSQNCAAEMQRRSSCQAVLSHTWEAAEIPPSAPCPQASLQAPGTTQACSSLPTTAAEVNVDLLQSGVAQLPGNRDKTGRAVIQICTHNVIWVNQSCPSAELTHLLLYYYSIPRKEVRELGLTILVDARRCPPTLTLFKAFIALQVTIPNAINSVLVLVERDSTFRPERDPLVQYELVSSLKVLHKHIDGSQLTQEFSGTFPYDHNDWIRFHMKLEPFMMNCRGALIYLNNSINSLSVSRIPSTEQEVIELIDQHQRIMKSVLEDSRLVGLRLEGGTILARIRKDEFSDTDDYRDAMDTITMLYNQVDEEVHKLVILSNKCQQQLEIFLELRKFEEGSSKIRLWAECEGEKHLVQVDCLPHSLESLRQMQEEYTAFYNLAVQHYRRGLQLINDAGRLNGQTHNELRYLDEKVDSFKQLLSNFINRLEKWRTDLDNIVNLHEFYETADQWVLHCNDYLRRLKVDEQSTVEYMTAVVQSLERYHQEATKFNAENFQRMNEMVLGLGSAKELKQWNIQWVKCQQTRHLLEEVLSAAVRIHDGHSNDLATKAHSEDEGPRTSGEFDTEGSDELGDSISQKTMESIENGVWSDDSANHQEPDQVFVASECPIALGYEESCQSANTSHRFSTTSSSSAPLYGRQCGGSVFYKDVDSCTVSLSAASCHSEPTRSPAPRHKKQPLKKIMRKTQSFEMWQRECGHGEAGRHGNTGVYIKGLEVVSSVVADKNRISRSELKSPILTRTRSLPISSRTYHPHTEEAKRTGSKLQHIMDEMISTEREYVKSLGYIIDHYFPEMERLELPQDLRGKRTIIFGNLEKLYDFHCQYFLKELEHCTNSPLQVSHCFLKHEEQFGMYALYSKNKPQSDALLASHGNTFFKIKQMALGDKMDLASYLLKPIQRMSKYALLLKDMIKQCSKTQEQELSDLQAAEEMVKFQLRHGNDLLAMDAIRGCDVNLKEQGQLMCQEEFIVCCGRKKYLRHIFLFEDLILFSKTKKIEGGYDIYIYKQSFKTAEIGMTENVGDSGLRFEIWFRRRKSQDTYIFQASSSEVKSTWTSVIGKILWRQALRNRELRMQEMVSMGIGNKPFMDIKPSEAAISDRAVDYIMKGTESRTRASIAVSSFEHSTSFKRPHSTISNSSTSSSSSQSSSSLLGTLNLHMYSSPTHVNPHWTPFNQWSYDIGTCIEEDELEQETGSQPSMVTESSETSSQCTSAESMSGSTLNCVSQLSTETFPDDTPNPDPKTPCHYTPLNLSPRMQRAKPVKNQYITASKPHVTISLSTLV
ncbi:pleckstrin homology domain-containing family G member 4B isoform X1 [Carcharodon carcharias]|uniref:pleckstrin homology domain-containing family G member 4B isoform X1 n=1 Tax=Carcharodon carcharias TaxID=13397 RepID=UPI001B7E3618|nr:pleckstrin homology domain-containing family G member 4B isoform X1 [Carcharodon carcharias]